MAKGKTVKKSAPAKKAGSGAATAARSKDTGKQAAGKVAAKKPAAKKPAAAKSQKSPATSRTATKSPSLAGKVLRKVKATASGAVDLAGSLIGRQGTEKSR
jgi:hypothetical protein